MADILNESETDSVSIFSYLMSQGNHNLALEIALYNFIRLEL